MSTEPRNLGIRLDVALTERLEAFERRTGVSGVTLGRNAIEAALTFFEAHGKISFPLVVIDESPEIAMLADKGKGYRSKGSGAAGGPSGNIQARNAAAPMPTYLIRRKAHILEPLAPAVKTPDVKQSV